MPLASTSFAQRLATGDDSDWPWLASVARALDTAPDVEAARALAGEVLDAADADVLLPLAAATPETLAQVLRALCGVAPFFARILRRHPEHLIWLLRDADLGIARTREDFESELDDHFPARPHEPAAERLRRFKYRELARITVRDSCDRWVPLANSDLTLFELSQLADVLLDRTLSLACQEIDASLEPPGYLDAAGDAHPLRFCALGLGKLGASELNYSSDVDLVYLCDRAPGGTRPVGADPAVYFARLAQAYGRLLSAHLQEGFLYRVDLELRPNGKQGALVVTDEALVSYYESWAHPWEKAAFTKARPVAGDLELGWRAIVAAAPAIFHANMNYGFADGIRSLKRKIASARGGQADAFDVKIDPGGIRDVEFIAQALQLLHGGRIPQLRDRSTQGALRSLEAVGLLPAETAAELHETYLFLRRIENRLQMEGERQVHRLPRSEAGMQRLARAMGYTGDDARGRFTADLERRQRFLTSLVRDAYGEGNRERVRELFTHAAPQLWKLEVMRTPMEALIDRFATAIDESGDAERALNNLDRFLRGVGTRRFYFELLLDRPELVPRMVALFAASNYLSSYLARYPRLIEPLFRDPDVLLLDREALAADYRAVLAQCAGEAGNAGLEVQLDALRLFHHRQVVNVGLLDLDKKTSRAESERALSEIAEVCIERALEIGRARLEESGREIPDAARSGGFLVVGMGKLASRELSYGSDLDLIFLYRRGTEGEGSEASVQDHFVRLAQRFISALQTQTALGACYEVDARLRPSGNQGLLVCSIQAYERYHETSAETWERQALLRARPVAGDAQLAEAFQRVRREILSRPVPETLAREIHHVRARMEDELARETPQRRDLKTGRGGALDVECAVQFLQLRHGGEHDELLEVAPLDEQRRRLERLGLLDAESAGILMQGWAFLQELASRLRIVENRSISSLDVEHSNLDTLARQLGYENDGNEGSARRRLIHDYRELTERVRRVYLDLLGVEARD